MESYLSIQDKDNDNDKENKEKEKDKNFNLESSKENLEKWQKLQLLMKEEITLNEKSNRNNKIFS